LLGSAFQSSEEGIVDEKHRDRTEDAAATRSEVEWIAPRVDRLIAGGAEAGGDTSTDGIDILS
jgi:hypothetical protein